MQVGDALLSGKQVAVAAEESPMIGLRVFVIVLSLLAAVITDAQQTSDPRIADLVKAGRVRFGMFPPQYTKEPVTGELKGPYVEVMRELEVHMGLPVVFKEVATPAELIECLKASQCDVGSLGFDPTRADQVGGFTPPFMQVDYTYLVPPSSAIHTIADADRPGVRIAVVRDHPPGASRLFHEVVRFTRSRG
jgi:ABC-type amino acid transport substrate-binding protein